MTILMVYHDLVGRDSKFVSTAWKFCTIFILVGIVLSSLGTSNSMYLLSLNFKKLCILDAQVVVNCTENPKTPKMPKYLRSLKDMVEYEFPVVDKNLCFIDEKETVWGVMAHCEAMIYSPLIGAIVGTIWLVFFMMCGHGGRGTDAVFSEPWRIVFPATICFAVASMLTFVYTIYLLHHLDAFCEQLRLVYYTVHPDENHPPCKFLVENFSMLESTVNASATNTYFSVHFFVLMMMLLWVFLLLVMVARILFVVDFQLVRVSVSLVGLSNRQIVSVDRPALDYQHISLNRRATFKSYLGEEIDMNETRLGSKYEITARPGAGPTDGVEQSDEDKSQKEMKSVKIRDEAAAQETCMTNIDLNCKFEKIE